MAKSKAAIGLSWEPKLPAFSSASKNGGGSGSKPRPEANPLWKPSTQLVDGLFVPQNDPVKRNKLAKKQIKDTAGTSWFDMPAPTMTPELQKDLQLLKLRNVMDPKRHYKKGDAQPNKYFQVGTVIESPLDFFSSRLTKKERKVSLAEEVLSDRNLGNLPVSRTLNGHKGYVSSCQYVPDEDTHLITGSGDQTCVLWDITTGLRTSVFGGEFQSGRHTADVLSVSINQSNSRLFVSDSCDTTARLWDTRVASRAVQTFHGHKGDVNVVKFFPDGNRFGTGSDDGTCRLFDIRTGQPTSKSSGASITSRWSRSPSALHPPPRRCQEFQ